MPKPNLKLKRVYDPAAKDDGMRILVDRVWPRGVAKEKAKIDLWLKDVAPSTALRKWFGHDPQRWAEFRERYFRELDANADAVAALWAHLRKGAVTLVYSAKDEQHNQAVALAEYLKRRSR
jgi:uncharacterized protein YeaO (DUF488 family)